MSRSADRFAHYMCMCNALLPVKLTRYRILEIAMRSSSFEGKCNTTRELLPISLNTMNDVVLTNPQLPHRCRVFVSSTPAHGSPYSFGPFGNHFSARSTYPPKATHCGAQFNSNQSIRERVQVGQLVEGYARMKGRWSSHFVVIPPRRPGTAYSLRYSGP
jgi:hypothetical protein